VFGRRKRQEPAADYEAADYQAADYQDAGPASSYPGDFAAEAAPVAHGGGPWDAANDHYPELTRVDLGSLLVPVGPEYDLQLVLAEQQGSWVVVHHGASDLQLQAFAAPRHGGLWEDVRGEIVAEIARAGGSTTEQPGPLGTELLASLPAQPGSSQFVPVRFAGLDGPRWFLRATFSGASALNREAAAPLELLMREVVVVRGDHPVPPRELLELRLPADAQQQFAQQQPPAQGIPNPFERGPEITETR
jgi:hypothetical protein